MIEENRLMLLSQLVRALKENLELFEKAYSSQDKEGFDSSKKVMLEAQRRIDYILKEAG